MLGFTPLGFTQIWFWLIESEWLLICNVFSKISQQMKKRKNCNRQILTKIKKNHASYWFSSPSNLWLCYSYWASCFNILAAEHQSVCYRGVSDPVLHHAGALWGATGIHGDGHWSVHSQGTNRSNWKTMPIFQRFETCFVVFLYNLKCFAVDAFCSYIPWSATLHLFSQSLSHCCSNHSDCNIHGDMYCKWFTNFLHRLQVS